MNGVEYVNEHVTKQQLIERLYLTYCPHDFGFKTELSVNREYCNNHYQGDCYKCWNSKVSSNKDSEDIT